MGEPTQKRLIRKIDLERLLHQVKPQPSPKVNLEQYTISEAAAATIMYLAAYNYGDIEGKQVLDLGCGTGRLALAAAFLGAESVVGIDIDKAAVHAAFANSHHVGLRNRVEWIAGDIEAVAGKFDTVVQNPPFGVQKRSADRRFLEKALKVGSKIYSLHNHPFTNKELLRKLTAGGGQLVRIEAPPFLARFVEKLGGRVEAVYALPLVIPHMFDFHTKARQEIVVDLYVIKSKGPP